MNNFDLMWVYVKSLAGNLMQNEENLLSDELYNQYISAFEQLMEIADNEPELISEERFSDLRQTVIELENSYKELQEKLKNKIKKERIQKNINNIYNISGNIGYNKKV